MTGSACSGGALFGAAWAAIPAYLQAARGSHIVITTIMFNLIGASVLNYVLVSVLRPTGQMEPSSAMFPETTHLPTLEEMLAPFGLSLFKGAPVNVTFFVAIIACVLVWLLIWRHITGMSQKGRRTGVSLGVPDTDRAIPATRDDR